MSSYLTIFNNSFLFTMIIKYPMLNLCDVNNVYYNVRQSVIMIGQSNPLPIVTLPLSASSITTDIETWLKTNNYTLQMMNSSNTYTIVDTSTLTTIVTNILSTFNY